MTEANKAETIRKRMEIYLVDHLSGLRIRVPIPTDEEIAKMTGRELTRRSMAGINNAGELGDPFLPDKPPWPDLAVPIMADMLGIDLSIAKEPETVKILDLIVRSDRRLVIN